MEPGNVTTNRILEGPVFWEYVYSSLQVMTHWDTYLVVSVYLFLMLAPIILIFLILAKKHALSTRYFRKLFLPVFEAIAIAIAVLTLFPIILGLGENALWNFPLKVVKWSPGGFLGLLGVLIVLAYIIDVIPKLRKLQSLKTLVLGGVCLIFVQIFLSFINPAIEFELINFIPGFWFILGVIIISGVLSKLGHFVFVAFARVLGNKFNLKEEVAELLILPVITTLGFLPVFIYGAWLA
jgi:hypothetical protein